MPPHLYRPSRRPPPSFPRKRESRTVLPKTGILLVKHFWIPAYAGMTVGAAGMTVETCGMTVKRGAGMTVFMQLPQNHPLSPLQSPET